MMELQKEEEEVGRSRDHTTKKGTHMYHPSVISCQWQAGRVVQNPPRVADIVVSRSRSPKTKSSILIGSSQRLRHCEPPASYRP
jgi:hypothetical protein